MDKATIIGLALGLVAFVGGTIWGAWPNLVTAGWMFDITSLIIVLGGGLGSAMAAVSMTTFVKGMKAAKVVFRPPTVDPAEGINQIVALANTARKEGVLALEDSAAAMEDEFLKKGIMLIVDGTDPELVKGIMETELAYIEERHGDIAGVYDNLAGFFPAWGMIGTLIGLILMLADLDDMAALAAGMATALVTTLYGSVLANVWAAPFASKLKQVNKEEMLMKTVLIEGMLSIQAGENPRIIEEKLKSFLAPTLRGDVGAPAAGGIVE